MKYLALSAIFFMLVPGTRLNAEQFKAVVCSHARDTWHYPNVPVAPVEKPRQLTHLAWLSLVGHERPGVHQRLPFSEAMETTATPDY